MIIQVLAENLSASNKYGCEHGLSLFIKTEKHKLLFDTGREKLFYENAQKMDIDLADIDLAVISHGHYDHGGGLRLLIEKNKKAMIYVNRKAFEKHYKQTEEGYVNIGLDSSLQQSERFIFADDILKIDDELTLFSDIKACDFRSKSQKNLMMENKGKIVTDTFEHEQNLIITQDDKTVLVVGCAHKGIVNILKRCIQIIGKEPDIVIGGFHLSNPDTKKSEDPEMIKEIGKYLKSMNTRYYTCHCTGIESFNMLKNLMGVQIKYFSTGSKIEFYQI